MQSDESLRDELLAEVEAVAPILTEHAPQSEKLGRLDEPTPRGPAQDALAPLHLS